MQNRSLVFADLILVILAALTQSGCTGATSSGSAPSTKTAPSITTQPASQTVIAGQTATFAVVAAGTAPLTYQWSKNGTAISNATLSTYTTPATTTQDNGEQFTVTVSNIAGNMTSNPATLKVNAATFILNASPPSLTFGNVTIGNSSTLPVNLTNAGNSNVNISNISILGAGVTSSGVSSGQILTPSETAKLNVTFAPSSTVPVIGNVTVSSNAINSPAVISLSGTGTTASQHSVSLDWSAGPGGAIAAGYFVYRGPSGGPYSKLNSSADQVTSYTDTSVLGGQIYEYVVTAIDVIGAESAFSAPVSPGPIPSP